MEEKLILEMLDSPYVETRLLATEFLAQAQEPSLAAILRAMEDEALPVREQAVTLASRHFPIERLIGLVGNHGNAVLRNSAIEALKRAGGRNVKALYEALGHKDVEVVMFTAQILGELTVEIDPLPLIDLLSHPDSNVAQAAIETLGKLRAREAVSRLLDILECDFWLQFAAIAALGEIGDQRAVPRLLALLEDELCQNEVLEALGKIGDLETLGPLISLWEKTEHLLFRDRLTMAVARIASGHSAGSARMEAYLGEHFQSQEDIAKARRYLLGALGPLTQEEMVSLPELALRNAAVYWLMRLPGAPEDLAPLVSQLKDIDLQKNLLSAFEALGARGIPALRTGLRDSEPEVRRLSARLLGRLADRPSLPILSSMLSDPVYEVRLAAAEALGNLGEAQVLPSLLPLLGAPDAELRDTAVRALARLEREVLIPPLVKYLEVAQEDFWSAALELVALAPDPRLVPFIRRALSSKEPQVVRAAIRAASRSSEIDLLAEVGPLLESESSAVRVQAIDALGTSGRPEAVDLLLPRLQGPETERYFIVRALGDLRATRATQVILDNFASFDPRIRLAAIDALGRIGGELAEAFLVRCLEGPFAEERRAAAAALSQQRPPSREELFLALAEDADWRLRNIAAYALGACQSEAARRQLKRLVKDRESVVARTALEALQRQETAGKISPTTGEEAPKTWETEC